MRLYADRTRPAVFLSFAGPDRPLAQRLQDDLGEHGVRAFVDDRDIPVGGNVVLALNSALARSDYYVLLWSRNAVDRPYVDAEWAAAYSRELHERRSFLFVLRLDDTPLPPLLAPRKFLDAADGWDAAVSTLVRTWRTDLDLRVPVVPAPSPATDEGPAIVLYVRNRALSVAHTVAVSPNATGHALHERVRVTLALPDRESRFGGQVGLRFTYRLLAAEEPLPDKPLSELGIGDGATVDLEVTVDPFGPDGPQEGWVMRGEWDPAALSAAADANERLVSAMERAAFRHLAP